MKSKITEYNLNDNFHFITGQKEIWPLFKKADILIRPTYSDGYSVSIEEAMSLGCKVIASEGFERAKGTIEFQNSGIIKCKDCYSSFEVLLLPVLEHFHGYNSYHRSKPENL